MHGGLDSLGSELVQPFEDVHDRAGDDADVFRRAVHLMFDDKQNTIDKKKKMCSRVRFDSLVFVSLRRTYVCNTGNAKFARTGRDGKVK